MAETIRASLFLTSRMLDYSENQELTIVIENKDAKGLKGEKIKFMLC